MAVTVLAQSGYLCFWAKYDAPSGNWHPLIAHALDTAAVARVLIKESLSANFMNWAAGHLELDGTQTTNLIVFLAASHDIGKLNPGFQYQSGLLRPRLESSGFVANGRIMSVPHGLITAHALQSWLDQAHALPLEVARPVASVVGGHHGVLPSPEQWRHFSGTELGGPEWGAARNAMLSLIEETVGAPLPRPSHLRHPVAIAIAGLICVADWIASNSDLFPYLADATHDPELKDATSYYRCALEGADKAVGRLGWRARHSLQIPGSFAELFPSFHTTNPLQREALALAKESAGPSLVLVEAAMGEGKTEAALGISEVWAASVGYRGMYFALPTQATSDQMFSRVRAFLETRAQGDRLTLQLLHGHASLSAEFADLRERGTQPFNTRGVGESGAECVIAGTWFTYRKRGLLASFGVGTVDQILMAALTSRHVFVRLFGLAGKTVIVDEVHAYDTYMSTLLERLLEWLAAMGSSVVLLSATLPLDRRLDLLKAYARGLQVAGPDNLVSTEYPRITAMCRAGARSVTFKSASPHAGKRIGLARIPQDGLRALLQDRLTAGGCAVVVCNTRRDAQMLFRELEAHFPGRASDGEPELDLLHSHFLFADRDALEKRCLRRFGKSEETSRPARSILIATQVVEQSLDLDFDLMVSALAPMDLLFQRVGRLHRHVRVRPLNVAKPSLVLIDTPRDEDGLPMFPRGHQFVYEPHLLFRTWLALQERDDLAIPEDIDPLLDTVYRDQPESDTLSDAGKIFWRETREKLRRHRANEQSAAQDRYLRSPVSKMAVWELAEPAYANNDPEQAQLLALTRLAEPSVRVVFLEQIESDPNQALAGNGEAIQLDRALSVGQIRCCLYRSVTISDRRVVVSLADTPPPVAFRSSPLLSEYRLLLVGADGAARMGSLTVRLDPRLGVVIDD